MLAGSSTKVTDFDGWMLRNWWYELSRKRGWQSTASSSASKGTSSEKAVTPVSSKAASTKTAVAKPTTTIVKQAATQTAAKPAKDTASSATAAAYAQCGGGAGYTGPTKCASGLKCTKHSEWYSQCL
jgi:hypothetical protein